jgi:hypothetical protein
MKKKNSYLLVGVMANAKCIINAGSTVGCWEGCSYLHLTLSHGLG